MPLKVVKVKRDSKLKLKKWNPSVNSNLIIEDHSFIKNFISRSLTDSLYLDTNSISQFSKNDFISEIEEIKQTSLRRGWRFEDTTCQLK